MPNLKISNKTADSIYIEVFDGELKAALSIGKLSLKCCSLSLNPGQSGDCTVKQESVFVTAASTTVPDLLRGTVTLTRGKNIALKLCVFKSPDSHSLIINAGT
jgi:hypothetical protein